MALKAGRKGVNSKNVDELGNIKSSDVPLANGTTAGIVNPVAATEEMLEDVGVAPDGTLKYHVNNGLSFVLLWTNPQSTVQPEQTISIPDISMYTHLMLEYSSGKTSIISLKKVRSPYVDLAEIELVANGYSCSVRQFLLQASTITVKAVTTWKNTPEGITTDTADSTYKVAPKYIYGFSI